MKRARVTSNATSDIGALVKKILILLVRREQLVSTYQQHVRDRHILVQQNWALKTEYSALSAKHVELSKERKARAIVLLRYTSLS